MTSDLEYTIGPIPEAKQQPVAAPYMSYRSLLTYIDRFRIIGLPARFDGSYFGNSSGSLVAQIRGTLRFFDLIDDERLPTDTLREISNADTDEDVKTYLRMLFDEKYADVNALESNATYDQLAEKFRERGLSGATVRKAATFYIGMAEDLGVPLSSHFKRTRTSGASGNGRKRRSPKADPPPPSPPVTETPTTTVEAQKAAYVNMLMELAKADTEADVQKGLLDRIEKALGIGAPPPEDGGS